MNSVEIKITKKMDLSGYTLIEGFPGIGLVGTIAAGYLTEKVNAEPIGFIVSKKFPPMASIHKGMPMYPTRIYVDKKHKLIILFSEFVVPAQTVHDIAESIVDWAKQNKIKTIFSLAGMTSRLPKKPEDQLIYGIASNKKMIKKLEDKKVKVITEGITTGVSGIIMAKCAMENHDAISILIESKLGYPDPRAAAELLEKLEEFLGFDIKTQDLVKEAEVIEGKMKNLMSQIKIGQKKYAQAETKNPMYG